jgi:hypothetical protein
MENESNSATNENVSQLLVNRSTTFDISRSGIGPTAKGPPHGPSPVAETQPAVFAPAICHYHGGTFAEVASPPPHLPPVSSSAPFGQPTLR